MTTVASPRMHGRRYFIMALLFSLTVINYIDRVNLSIAAPAISKYFHWDAVTMGWVFSAYMWSYIIFQIPSGMLVDRYGSYKVASASVSLWSFATVCTGAVTGFGSMMLARLGLGMGEASVFTIDNKVVRQWFPSGERAFATSIFHSGIAVAKVGTPLIALAIVKFGWRWSFVVTAIPGFIWLLVWLKWFRQPEECSWISADERKLILETRQGRSGAAGTTHTPLSWSSLSSIMGQKSVWGVCLAQGCMNYTGYLFMAWLPMYLMFRGMNLMKAGIMTAIPNLVGAAMEVALGKLSDRLLTPESVRRGKRRLHIAILFVGMLLLSVIRLLDNEWALIAVISVVLGCTFAIGALNSSLTNDLTQDPKITGTVFGMLHFISAIFGAAAPIVTGYIVQATRGYNGVYIPATVLALIGAVVVMTMTRQPIKATIQLETGSATAAGKG